MPLLLFLYSLSIRGFIHLLGRAAVPKNQQGVRAVRSLLFLYVGDIFVAFDFPDDGIALDALSY